MTTLICTRQRTRRGRAAALALAVAATMTASMALAPVASAANLVQNGGFEVNDGFGDFANWEEFSSLDPTGQAHSGAAAADFFLDQTAGLRQYITTIVGATYRVQFWLEQEYDGVRAFGASFGNQLLLAIAGGTLNQPYTLMSYDVTATSALSALEFFGYNAGADFRLDDVSVELLNRLTAPTPVPEPGTAAVLAAGLLGLAIRRRAARTSA